MITRWHARWVAWVLGVKNTDWHGHLEELALGGIELGCMSTG